MLGRSRKCVHVLFPDGSRVPALVESVSQDTDRKLNRTVSWLGEVQGQGPVMWEMWQASGIRDQ